MSKLSLSNQTILGRAGHGYVLDFSNTACQPPNASHPTAQPSLYGAKTLFRLVSCEFASSSGCPVILVFHAAQDAAPPDRLVDRDDHAGVVVGWMLI